MSRNASLTFMYATRQKQELSQTGPMMFAASEQCQE